MKQLREHTYFEELLLLSLYDELGDAERAEIRSHLDVCAACRKELKELAQMQKRLAGLNTPVVSDAFLKEARMTLPVPRRNQRFRNDMLQRFLYWLDGLTAPRAQLVWASLLFLCVGFGAGYVYVQRSASPSDMAVQQGETRTENIRVVSADPVSGEVELSGERISTMHIKAKIDDQRIVVLMAKALADDRNPGVRLQAVSLIARQGDIRPSVNPVIKKALINAAMQDENPAVRKEALLALGSFPFDTEIQSAVLSVLVHDENAGLRITAIDALQLTKYETRLKDRAIQSALNSCVSNDKNTYVRQQAQLFIQEAITL